MDFTKDFYSETAINNFTANNCPPNFFNALVDGFSGRELFGVCNASELVEHYLTARTQLAAMGFTVCSGSHIDFEKEVFHVMSVKAVLGTMGSPAASISYANSVGYVTATFPKTRYCQPVKQLEQGE